MKIPFADYKDFADCVSKNQDKRDPEAYCAVVHHKITGKYPSQKNCVTKSEYRKACVEMMSESFKETYSPEQLASKAQAVYISTSVGGHALDMQMQKLDLDNHKEYEYVINQKLNGKYVGVLFLLTPLAVARWVQTGGMSGFNRTSVADLKKDKYELWEGFKEQGLGKGWKKVKETPTEILWVREDEKSNIQASKKDDGTWTVSISVPSGATRKFDAKDMSQAKRIAGAETHKYNMVLKNRIESLYAEAKYGLVNQKEVAEYEHLMKITKGSPVKVKIIPGTSNVSIEGGGSKVYAQLGTGRAKQIVEARLRLQNL